MQLNTRKPLISRSFCRSVAFGVRSELDLLTDFSLKDQSVSFDFAAARFVRNVCPVEMGVRGLVPRILPLVGRGPVHRIASAHEHCGQRGIRAALTANGSTWT
jgi:hypothetical protein